MNSELHRASDTILGINLVFLIPAKRYSFVCTYQGKYIKKQTFEGLTDIDI